MLDFPTIAEPPAAAPAPQPVAAEQTRAITASIGVVQGEVAKFDLIAAGLKAIEDAHPKNVIVAAIDTPAGMKAAETAWRAYRNPRLEVERARKAAKAPVLALGKAIDTFAGSLEERLLEGETHYKSQITREEDRKEAVRAEAARIEREAQERHAARLQVIAGYLTRCQEPGMTAERIQKGIDLLNASDVSDDDTARADALIGAKARALESMRLLHAQAVAREAEAARQQLIRQENERVAAENAREAARIAAEAEAIRRAGAELAAQQEAARLAALPPPAPAPEPQQTRAEVAPAVASAAPQAPEAAPQPHHSAQEVQEQPKPAGHAGAPAPRVVLLSEPEPDPVDALLAELAALAKEARESRFPTQPKMGLEWWARFYALADQVSVLTGNGEGSL